MRNVHSTLPMCVGVATLAVMLGLTTVGCSKKTTTPAAPGFQAVDAIVDIPPCLTTSSHSAKAANDSVVDGAGYYDMECGYIKTADGMATMVRQLLGTLQNVAGEFSGDFVNSADGRTKHMVITQTNTMYNEEVYNSRLDIYDAGDLAFRMYYDTGAVVKGVVTMAPMYIDYTVGTAYTDTRIRITYNRSDATYAKALDGVGVTRRKRKVARQPELFQ